MDTDDLEACLATAVAASLSFPAEQRPSIIALKLLELSRSEYFEVELPKAPEIATHRPAHLEAELEQVRESLRDAVNSAARRPESDMVESIADYLLRLNGGDGLHSAADMPEEITGGEGGEGGEGAEAVSVTPSGLSAALAQKKASRPAEITKGTLFRQLGGRDGGGNGGTRRVKLSAARLVLGKSASSQIPAVLGAMQEVAANRAAREINVQVVREATLAGERLASVKRVEDAEEKANANKLSLPAGILPSR